MIGWKLLASVSSIVASATLSFYFFSPLAVIPIFVVTAHELGHYFTAKSLGSRQVDHPVLIPTFPFIIGLTRVKDLKYDALVAYAGPLFGSATALAYTIVSLAIASPAMLLVSGLTLLFELSSFFFSSDARKAAAWLEK